MTTRKRTVSRGMVLAAAALLLVGASWRLAEAGPRNRRQAQMTRAVEAALRKAFPGARVRNIEPEPRILMIYEVEMLRDGKMMEAEFFVNGECLTVARPTDLASLPAAVSRTLGRQAAGGRIAALAEKEVRATIAIHRLAKPKTVYAVEVVRGERTIKLEIDPQGQVVQRKVTDDDDERNEREISLDQAPPAVRATILRHAGEHRVREVEVQTRRDGTKVYEAEWRENGKEVEVAVAPDGTLLGKHTEEDEDDDEDDDDEDDDD